MEARQIQRDTKVLLTDLAADRDKEAGLAKYRGMLAASFSSYALIKLSLNFFTLCEMEQDREGAENGERSEDYWTALSLVRSILGDSPEKEEAKTRAFRDRITARMKVLTAYTDFFELHEYILNRKEAGLLDECERISPEQLAEEAFSYVFSDQDKMVINTRIQSVVEQLPVRMTKQRFYDIVSEAVALYKGGELQSAKDFIESLADAALLRLPEGFDTEFPELKETRDLFDAVTYKELDREEYAVLSRELAAVTRTMEGLATGDLLLQEIINDILIVQLTAPLADREYMDDRFSVAKEILQTILTSDKELPAEQFDNWFLSLEGAQEEAYETLLLLEGGLESYADELSDTEAKALRTADLLTSTSLFMNLDQNSIHVVEEKAEEAEIEKLKTEFFEACDATFAGLSKEEKRSRMAKVLSMVPVFFNSRDEIKEYFLYALENCRDDSELTAVSRIIHSMIQG